MWGEETENGMSEALVGCRTVNHGILIQCYCSSIWIDNDRTAAVRRDVLSDIYLYRRPHFMTPFFFFFVHMTSVQNKFLLR